MPYFKLGYLTILYNSIHPIAPQENNILFLLGHDDIVGWPHTGYAELLLTKPI